jgi:flagellar motor switch protein FliM
MSREATCDFPRSDSVTPTELRSLQTLHAGMSDALAAEFSTVVRSPVDVSLAGVDQFAYGKLVHGIAGPTYFAVLKAEPLGDCLMLDVDLAILYPMLDRMLGGGHQDEPPPRRPLSDIELPLAGRVVRAFLDALCQTWRTILPLSCEMLQVESQPQRLRLLPSEETVVVIAFALTVGNRQGAIRLCVPCRAVKQITDKLVDAQFQARPPTADSSEDASNAHAACDPCTGVVVMLAAGPISASDLRGLRVGDVIATDSPAGSPAAVLIDGQPQFRAQPGACHGRKAVVLSEATGDCQS